ASHDHNATDDDSDDNVDSSKIIQPPPGGVTNRIQGTAIYVAKKGFRAGKMLMQSEANPRYNFLRRSHLYYAFYKHMLAEYRSQENDNDDDATDSDDDEAQVTITQSQYIALPNHLLIVFLIGNKCAFGDSNTDDERFNFLKSSEDPYHALYKQKLDEYASDPRDEYYQRKIAECYVQNRKGATDVSYPMDIKIFHAPPDAQTAAIVDRVAFLVSKYGWQFKMMVMASNTNDARFDFLMSSPDVDLAQAYYQRRLTEYYCRVLEGMTLEELDTVNVTAQFVAWYGDVFRGKLMERVMMNHQFEFMKQTDYRFSFFNEFVVAFSQVLHPPNDLKDKLNNNAAYMTAILEGFLERILWDHVRELKWLDGGENSMIEWHNSASKDFVEDHELLPLLEISPPAPLPPQKRPELDESALGPLEPEDQFLAQHQGLSSTNIIRVICVPDGGVIKITVQSLSENVASLKEKIAEVVQIPANKHMLSGSRAVLKDNNRSLSYYNVKSGAILILDVV
ncbi:SWAP/Surp, partial [Arabidopsis suecica]